MGLGSAPDGYRAVKATSASRAVLVNVSVRRLGIRSPRSVG